jgi:hypothetical protein
MKYLFSQIHEEQSLTADNKQKKIVRNEEATLLHCKLKRKKME